MREPGVLWVFFAWGWGWLKWHSMQWTQWKKKPNLMACCWFQGKGSQLQKPPKNAGLIILTSFESFNLIDHLPKTFLFFSKYLFSKRLQHQLHTQKNSTKNQNPTPSVFQKRLSPEVEKTLSLRPGKNPKLSKTDSRSTSCRRWGYERQDWDVGVERKKDAHLGSTPLVN